MKEHPQISTYEEAFIEVQDDDGEWSIKHYYPADRIYEAGSPVAAAQGWLPRVRSANKRVVKRIITKTITEELV